MESIGEKLRATREEKSLSIDQVARDTNIAKRYIVALEDEAFSEFPGEPYLIGFLRNYADYLGLEAEEIVSLYKNFKIQEQPVPMEELLESKHRHTSPLLIVGIVVLVGLIIAGIFLIPPYLSRRSGASAVPTAKVQAAGAVYQLNDEVVERRFVSGDTVVVPVGDKSYRVKLTVSGRNLLLTYAGGQQSLAVGEEKSIDLNGDGTPDVKVFLRDIDLQDPAHGVVVRFDRFTQSPSAPAPAQQAAKAPSTPAASGTGAAPASSAPAATAASPPAASASPAPQSSPAPAAVAAPSPVEQNPVPSPQSPAPAAQSPSLATQSPPPPAQVPAQPAVTVPTIVPADSSLAGGPLVILHNSSSTPFTVNVDFSGSCLFRYQIDGTSEDQRYFQKGETTRLEVNKDLEIWASNGGALDVTIAGNHVDMGNPGQIIARKIGWVQDQQTGDFQLLMTSLR